MNNPYLYYFPNYPANNQTFTYQYRNYRFYIGLELPDFADLVIRTEFGAWVAVTRFREVDLPRNPTNQDDPTEFIKRKRISSIRWINTDTRATFVWVTTQNIWTELDY